MAYRIEYYPDAIEHLKELTKRNQSIIFNAIENQLTYQPNIETKQKKKMRPNQIAPWELRVGNFRIYYDIEIDSQSTVIILAIGIKERNKIYIGNKEVEL